MKRGREKAANSGKALEEILEQINEVTMQINQIATAAEEQTATTTEISNNMQQITEVVAPDRQRCPGISRCCQSTLCAGWTFAQNSWPVQTSVRGNTNVK